MDKFQRKFHTVLFFVYVFLILFSVYKYLVESSYWQIEAYLYNLVMLITGIVGIFLETYNTKWFEKDK